MIIKKTFDNKSKISFYLPSIINGPKIHGYLISGHQIIVPLVNSSMRRLTQPILMNEHVIQNLLDGRPDGVAVARHMALASPMLSWDLATSNQAWNCW